MEGRASDGSDLSKPPQTRDGRHDDESSKSDKAPVIAKGGKNSKTMQGSYTPQKGSPKSEFHNGRFPW